MPRFGPNRMTDRPLFFAREKEHMTTADYALWVSLASALISIAALL
jgi:hypothetical protein